MIEATGRQRCLLESGAVFVAAAGFLLALAPSAPFTKELGVCESGAVRDVLADNIILPRFLPGPIVHVPPLYWWTAALCVKAFGWNELALRLPSLLAAALTCGLIFAWVSRTLSRRAAWWSVTALLFCHFFLDAARQPRMDSMLALGVTAAAMCLERAIAQPRGPGPLRARSCARAFSSELGPPPGTASLGGEKHLWWFVMAAAAIGFGTLSKGLLGVVLPGLALAVFLFVRGRLRELFRLDVLTTFMGGFAIGLAWFVAGVEVGGRAFVDWQVRMNLWSRFIPASAGGAAYCVHPFWYFGPQTLSGFLPWSLYLPAFALALWPPGRRLPVVLVYVLCWFAAIFIFFSSAHGKCSVYILPAFPPLAIMVGWTIAEVHSAVNGRKWMERLFRAASAIIALATALMMGGLIAVSRAGLPAQLLARLHPTDRRFLAIFTALAARPSALLLAWLFFSTAGIVLILDGIRRGAATRQACGTLAIAAAGAWFWFGVMNPTLARRETLRTFAREVAAAVPAGAPVAHLGLGDCELNFYSPQPLAPLFELSCADPAAPRFVVIRQRDFEKIAPVRRACFRRILASAPVDSIGRRLLLERTTPP